MNLLRYTLVYLIIFDMVNFDVFQDMYLLFSYYVVFDCNAKMVSLVMLDVPRLECRFTQGYYPKRVILLLQDRWLVQKTCLSYLAYVRDTSVKTPPLESVRVVKEFEYVFHIDLLGVPPNHDMDFGIDLCLGIKPIFIFHTRVYSMELKEGTH